MNTTPTLPLEDILDGHLTPGDLMKAALASTTGNVILTRTPNKSSPPAPAYHLSLTDPRKGRLERNASQRLARGLPYTWQGLNRERLDQDIDTCMAERTFASEWARENSTSGKPSTLATILGGDVSKRDAAVAATLMQWLGTKEGQALLIRAMESYPGLKSAILEGLE